MCDVMVLVLLRRHHCCLMLFLEFYQQQQKRNNHGYQTKWSERAVCLVERTRIKWYSNLNVLFIDSPLTRSSLSNPTLYGRCCSGGGPHFNSFNNCMDRASDMNNTFFNKSNMFGRLMQKNFVKWKFQMIQMSIRYRSKHVDDRLHCRRAQITNEI